MIIKVNQWGINGRKTSIPIKNIKCFYKNDTIKNGLSETIKATTIEFLNSDDYMLVNENANLVQDLICKAHDGR